MLEQKRIPQTILLGGPEGVGKATLARRFAAALLGDPGKVERDDLSLPENKQVIEAREKWPSDKRTDDPLLFSSHPDFITFCPDGPLRQITIEQIRLLRERSQLKPLKGDRRVFLIDRIDRASKQSGNSLLKVLEEPPEHLVLIGTAENLYDVLPTIRSRSILLQMSSLTDEELRLFVERRNLPDPEIRTCVAEGSPGIAASLDVDEFRQRRGVLLTAFECGAGIIPFSTWVQHSEAFANSKSEKLDLYLKIAYSLLGDLLATQHGRPAAKNRDVQARITALAKTVDFRWLERAASALDELVEMVRRNIQKTGALDAMIIRLRNPSEAIGTF